MTRATVIELVATATTTSGSIGRRTVHVRLSASLSDGRDVTLLDDRGYTSSINRTSTALPERDEDELFTCAWCVGPDEKFDDRTDKDMADDHFGALAAKLAAADIHTTAEALMSTPFRAVWGDMQRIWPQSLDWY